MKLSIVIPTINIGFDFNDVLGEEDFLNKNIEVVIVKQDVRAERPISISERRRGRIIVKEIVVNKKGLSRARNLGVEHSEGSVIVFLDDDVKPALGYFDSLAQHYIESDADITFGVIKYVDFESYNFCGEKIKYQFGKVISVSMATGAGSTISVKRSSWDKHNLAFIEGIGAGTSVICGEDSVFCLQAFQSDLRIYSTKSTVIYHPVSGSTMHVRNENYYVSLWFIYKEYYGVRGYFLGARFAMKLLIKELSVTEFFRFLMSYYAKPV
ncbi:glycosyltransferase family 2 protein [Marinobacterium jannaschii]|uniref:glycosyltransferase family 2 protein n=1 Tax=Marinobacterium jannaschii TaxID=64970 RepID=UPI000483250C|nr:glycosyltransferase [Marinobacterium jannaschii]